MMEEFASSSLTEAGLGERAELDQRADAFARSLLEPLGESQRVKLVAAMAQVERLLIASMVQITVADPTSQDARWCIEQYFTELGERFETGFDPTLSISAHAHELVPRLVCCSLPVCERSLWAVAH